MVKNKKTIKQYHIITIEQLETEAIEFIKKYEPPEGYFLAFSGGKDSVVLYDLAKKAKVKFYAFYNNTLIDPPELTKFIRDYYPEVVHIYPRKTFWTLVTEKGIPMFKKRFCCEILKENSNNECSKQLKVKLVGIRAEESWKRAKRGRVSKIKNITYVKPIFYWSTADIWDYIHKYKLPYCELYDEGFARLGCIVCPLMGKTAKRLWKQKYPHYFKLFKKFALIYYEKRKDKLNKEKYFKYLSEVILEEASE